MKKATLDVRGMSCDHCKKSVEGALQNLKGVTEVDVDLSSGKVNVTYDEAIAGMDQIKQAIEEQGYDVVNA